MRGAPVSVNELAVPIPDLPVGLRGLRIAHVSDFHFRRWNRTLQAAQDTLLALQYDLLVVTGDLQDGRTSWRHAVRMIRTFFDPLATRSEILAVLGNHDHPNIAAAENMPATFLRNAASPVKSCGTDLEIIGVEQSLHGGEDLSAALNSGGRARVSILLAHYPSTVFRIPSERVKLVLSGHTHGGQIRLPLLGCIWAHDRIPVRMARGLHRVRGVWLHTNPGIGASWPVRVRINCPPEVSLLTLERPGAPSDGAPL
jgi:predicted MPP superfamily phosphohydrolase